MRTPWLPIDTHGTRRCSDGPTCGPGRCPCSRPTTRSRPNPQRVAAGAVGVGTLRHSRTAEHLLDLALHEEVPARPDEESVEAFGASKPLRTHRSYVSGASPMHSLYSPPSLTLKWLRHSLRFSRSVLLPLMQRLAPSAFTGSFVGPPLP